MTSTTERLSSRFGKIFIRESKDPVEIEAAALQEEVKRLTGIINPDDLSNIRNHLLSNPETLIDTSLGRVTGVKDHRRTFKALVTLLSTQFPEHIELTNQWLKNAEQLRVEKSGNNLFPSAFIELGPDLALEAVFVSNLINIKLVRPTPGATQS